MTQQKATRRRYDNSGRAQKAEQTKLDILRALADQLTRSNSVEFSVEDAAREAGVTPRTVFRHFPSKDHMLEALSRWVLGFTGKIPLPADPDEVVDSVSASYELFENHAELMQALLVSELGRGVRSRLTARRRSGIAEALAEPVSALPPDEAKAVLAVLIHLVAAETWWQVRKEFAVKGDASAEVVAWIVRLVLEALERGDSPSHRHHAE